MAVTALRRVPCQVLSCHFPRHPVVFHAINDILPSERTVRIDPTITTIITRLLTFMEDEDICICKEPALQTNTISELSDRLTYGNHMWTTWRFHLSVVQTSGNYSYVTLCMHACPTGVTYHEK